MDPVSKKNDELRVLALSEESSIAISNQNSTSPNEEFRESINDTISDNSSEINNNRAMSKLPKELLFKILRYAFPEPKTIEFTFHAERYGEDNTINCFKWRNDCKGQIISNLALVSYAFNAEMHRHFSTVTAPGPIMVISELKDTNEVSRVIKEEGRTVWANNREDTLHFFCHGLEEMLETGTRWMLQSRLQRLCVTINGASWTAGWDRAFDFLAITSFAQETFPELKHLFLILGYYNDLQLSGDLRLIEIDKDFVEMELSARCPGGTIAAVADRNRALYHDRAEALKHEYGEYAMADWEFWKNVDFKVVMRAYFKEGYGGWDQTNGTQLYRSPTIWIDNFQCYVPCDSKGEKVASRYDGLVDLFEGYQPRFESWFRKEQDLPDGLYDVN